MLWVTAFDGSRQWGRYGWSGATILVLIRVKVRVNGSFPWGCSFSPVKKVLPVFAKIAPGECSKDRVTYSTKQHSRSYQCCSLRVVGESSRKLKPLFSTRPWKEAVARMLFVSQPTLPLILVVLRGARCIATLAKTGRTVKNTLRTEHCFGSVKIWPFCITKNSVTKEKGR